LPRPAGGDRRRLPEGDAPVHECQSRPGVAVPLDVVVHQLHPGRDPGKEKIAIAESPCPRRHDEAARLRDTPVEQGTALDTAGNGRFARKVIVHCKHERARRLSARPPQLLAQATDTDLIVNEDDLRRAIAAALATN
ncbi:MAG: hypothetical protein QOD97_2780, partial [Mycobacterium sp.]|nr:hypothetical protein [Mycobacterium sp.]